MSAWLTSITSVKSTLKFMLCSNSHALNRSKFISDNKNKFYFPYNIHRVLFHSTLEKGKSCTKDVSGKLPRFYESARVESEWYDWWEKEGFFYLASSLAQTSNARPFTMILPPPNITGTLHLGHALTVTIQDVIARWRRMSGQSVIWIPGTDHAGIATQVVVEKQLYTQQKTTRHLLGRKKFNDEVWKWQREKSTHIQNQLRLMGASLDWSKEYFTMDKKQSFAVVEAFIQLFEEGLIYRNHVPVSWSCWLRSTISDIEIDNHEINGPTTLQVAGYGKPILFGTLTNIAYKGFKNDAEIIVSTTRPETILGDVAIAVHPEDPRYTHLHGSFFWHPYRSEKIPLICDTFVDRDFGTGAVKITPAHDKVDFEVAKRHNLKVIPVIYKNGTIRNEFGLFKGMKRFYARESILEDLASKGLLRGDFPHKMTIPICGRSGDVVELIPIPQWFLSTKNMAEKAIQAVKKNHLHLVPDRAQQFWMNWFENNQDWCLSRQLWWGHRIPAYKCSFSNNINWVAARNEQEAKDKAALHFSCQPNDSELTVEQDTDVLDTWFSSSILPFSTVGWPDKKQKMESLYPLSLMETGNDILLFWVARMVMLGEHFTHQLPFKDVFLHGVIRDASGRKMSKSVGNVVSPEEIREGRSLEELVEKVAKSHKSGVIAAHELQNAIGNQRKMFPHGISPCGTDALRLSLLFHPIDSHFIDFDVKQCEAFHRFCNKIWQAFRYIEGVFEHSHPPAPISYEKHEYSNVMDLWILSRLSALISNFDSSLSNLCLHECVHGLRSFVHNEFCDIYLESTKSLQFGDNSEAVQAAKNILVLCAENILALSSPFVPYLAEELYQRTPYIQKKAISITLYPFPQPSEWFKWRNPQLDKEIDFILCNATAVKKLKNINGLKMKEYIPITFSTKPDEELHYFNKHRHLLESLAHCSVAEVLTSVDETSINFMTNERVNDNCVISIILDENQKKLSEKHKQEQIKLAIRRQMKLLEQISRTKKTVEAPNFETRASEEMKKSLYEKLATLQEDLKRTEIFLDQVPENQDTLREEILRERLREKEMKSKQQL